MTKIILRLLLVLVLIFMMALTLLSAITGINIYERYRKQILIGICVFCGMVMSFYISLALLGIS